MINTCRVVILGTQDYWTTHQYQKELVRAVAKGEVPDTMVLVNHPAVFTLGRNGLRENILVSDQYLKSHGIKVYNVERSGDVTYHGLGQLVGYPIMRLKDDMRDLHKLMYLYEEVILHLLTHYKIKAQRLPGHPGVWVGDKIIAAFGVGANKWVSYHGFALNINPNLEHFDLIVPCGFKGKGVTSMAKHLGYAPFEEEVIHHMLQAFEQIFRMKTNIILYSN
ncbi:MAG: lipoyl(octanoyl) transferase LipB [Thermincolia bacterium]